MAWLSLLLNDPNEDPSSQLCRFWINAFRHKHLANLVVSKKKWRLWFPIQYPLFPAYFVLYSVELAYLGNHRNAFYQTRQGLARAKHFRRHWSLYDSQHGLISPIFLQWWWSIEGQAKQSTSQWWLDIFLIKPNRGPPIMYSCRLKSSNYTDWNHNWPSSLSHWQPRGWLPISTTINTTLNITKPPNSFTITTQPVLLL